MSCFHGNVLLNIIIARNPVRIICEGVVVEKGIIVEKGETIRDGRNKVYGKTRVGFLGGYC